MFPRGNVRTRRCAAKGKIRVDHCYGNFGGKSVGVHEKGRKEIQVMCRRRRLEESPEKRDCRGEKLVHLPCGRSPHWLIQAGEEKPGL